MIRRVFVGSGPFVCICKGVSTEMMDIEGMASRMLSWLVTVVIALSSYTAAYCLHNAPQCTAPPCSRHCGSAVYYLSYFSVIPVSASTKNRVQRCGVGMRSGMLSEDLGVYLATALPCFILGPCVNLSNDDRDWYRTTPREVEPQEPHQSDSTRILFCTASCFSLRAWVRSSLEAS